MPRSPSLPMSLKEALAPVSAPDLQVVLISGLSGSGKSVALAVLEDSGYYCIDNLPAQFLLLITASLAREGKRRIAIAVDVRSGASLVDLPQHIAALREEGMDVRFVFLEARTGTLVKRFSETRRKHPLSEDERTVEECIELEREQLADLVNRAQRIDTSDMHANTLRAWIKLLVGAPQSQLTLVFESFGFKHGLPLDADLVFDARPLPNPHYDPVLRPLTGKDEPVADFLRAAPSVGALYQDILHFVEKWLPNFVEENRSYLTVAVGCTGGQHRSVYLVENLAAHFAKERPVLVRHRELQDHRAQ